jgi:hypothetical protein
MTLVLASCTAKKRRQPSPELRAAALPVGDLTEVLAIWVDRLNGAQDRIAIEDLYTGNGWRHARAAAQQAGADLAVVSAGLGVARASALAPAYGLTVVSADDDIRRRISPGVSPAEWWRALSSQQLMGPGLIDLLEGEDGLVLAALPETYLAMVEDDLAASRPAREGRLRLFTGGRPRALGAHLAAMVMPYDARLADPALGLGGTADSFAGRALRHFVQTFAEFGADDLDRAKTQVLAALDGRSAPIPVVRQRYSDAEITTLLRERWGESQGVASRLLRILRDDLGVACAQSRIARLASDLRLAGGLDVV